MVGHDLGQRRSIALFGLCVATTLLAACSSGSGLTTGSLLPGSKPKVADPAIERAMQVALTSARASKCGYNFDPAKLKTSYLAYESTQSGGAEQVARLEKSYDFTRNSASSKMSAAEDYCTDDQTAKIKADLSRHMAGDFSASVKPAEAGVADWWSSKSPEVWDKQKTFCPNMSCT